jgi:murein DD-endopeptidase MepM/ murein hydrolase activator NlpD
MEEAVSPEEAARRRRRWIMRKQTLGRAGQVPVLEAARGYDFGLVKRWEEEAPHDIPVRLPKDAFPIVSDWQSAYTTYGTIRGAYRALKVNHQGVDVAAPIGTPVLAVADGVVMLSGRGQIAGERIAVEHGRARAREGGDGVLISEYIHLKRRLVFAGERVSRGQIIGTLGITGHGAAGHVPHLHYATSLVDGRTRRRVNPHQYWYAGPGKVRLYKPEGSHADDPLRHTYPVPCRRTLAPMIDLLDELA